MDVRVGFQWKILLLPVLAVILSTAAGAEETAKVLEPVVLQLHWKHQFEFSGYYAAKEQGYFQDAGLDVDIREISYDDSAIEAVMTGRADYGIGLSNLVHEGIRGTPVVLLANEFKHSPVILLAHPSITALSKLKGKRVMGRPEDVNNAEIAYMFRLNDIRPEDIEWIPQSFDVWDVIRGKAAAMSAYITNQPIVLREKGVSHQIFNPGDYQADFYGNCLFTSKQEARRRPKRTRRFVEAAVKGWTYAIWHKEELIDLILRKYSSKKSRKTLRYEAEAIHRLMQPKVYPIGAVDPDRIQRIADILVDLNLAPPDYDLSGFLFEGPDISAGGMTPRFTPEEKTLTENHREYTVAFLDSDPPFSYLVDGDHRGFSADYYRLLSEKTGLVFKPVFGSRAQNRKRVKNGKADILDGVFAGAGEVDPAFLYTPPYYTIPWGLFAQTNFGHYSGIEQLFGKRVGIKKGARVKKALFRFNRIDLIEGKSAEAILRALSLGTLDAVVIPAGTGMYYIKTTGLPDIRYIGKIELPKVSGTRLHMGVSKRNPVLHRILTKGIQSVEGKELLFLQEKWIYNPFGSTSPHPDLFLSASENAYLIQKGRITYCLNPLRMPLEGIRNNHSFGMAAEFTTLFQKRLGIPFEFIPTGTYERYRRFVTSGRCDILPLVDVNDCEAMNLKPTKPFMEFATVLVTRDNAPFVGSLRDMAGRKVGVAEAHLFRSAFIRRFDGVSFTPERRPGTGLKKVSDGRLSALVIALPIATYHIRRLGLTNLKVATHIDYAGKLAAGVRKDLPQLWMLLNKTVSSLTETEKDDVYRKWISIRFSGRIEYTRVAVVFALLSVLLAGVLLWNRKLAALNKRITDAHNLLAAKNRELERLSTTDPLTGLKNRLKLNGLLEKVMERFAQNKEPAALIFLDMDHFKVVNNIFGQAAGDKALQMLGIVLTANIRQTDIAGRWGGEEFLIICPETAEAGAYKLAESLRQIIEDTTFPDVGGTTCSFGVSVFQEGDRLETVLNRANTALNQAKAKGRNRVEVIT
jgi:diguanylate cyclase (GGDEF)-like protein